MQRPHWLDRVFEKPTLSLHDLLEQPRFKAAIAKAHVAYSESQQELNEQPGLIGCVPSQAARNAFLQELQLQVDFQDP